MSDISDLTGINIDLPNKNVSVGVPEFGGIGKKYYERWQRGQGQDAAVPMPVYTEEDFAKWKYEQDKQALSKQMMDQAKNFRGQIPGYEQTLYSQLEGQAKNAIAEEQREIKRLSNRRGLLYSGLRQGSEAAASSEIGSKAAGQKAKIAPELERIAENIDAQAAKTAQANYKDDLALMSQVYDRALADARSRVEQLGQLGEVAGTVVGNYFGSRNPESDMYERQKSEYSMGLDGYGRPVRAGG